jgi:hypothetical protein
MTEDLECPPGQISVLDYVTRTDVLHPIFLSVLRQVK